MKVCLAQLPEALEFAEKALDLKFPGGTTWVASRKDNGDLAGVAVFTFPQKGNTFLHIAAVQANWFTPEFRDAMFAQAFLTLAARRITASILATALPCERLAKRLGFVLEGQLIGFDFGDLLMYRMLKGECKWVD